MKIFTIIIFLFTFLFISAHNSTGQSNPTINVLPANSGLVPLGGILDLQITIGNTGSAAIPAFKLRPIITVPNAIVTILPTQTGLPTGWSVVTNDGTQIRICNGADPIPSNVTRTIIIKVQAIAIGGPSAFQAVIAFGSATSCANSGPAVPGNNLSDDISSSNITVFPGCNLGVTASAGIVLCNGGTTNITATTTAATGPVEYSITGGVPFQISNTFSNVIAGTYTVTAREVNNPATCIATTNITITEPAAIPAPTVTIIQPSCTVANAMVTLSSSTTGLIFSIDNGTYAPYPAGGYSLVAGAHTLTAKNINNCLSPVASFTVNTQPPSPSAPIIGTVTQPNCNVSTGSVILNNLPTGTWITNPGNIPGSGSSTSLLNLAAGTYTFTVTNAIGCTSPPSATVTINAVVGAPAAPVLTLTQPTCVVATGSLIITSPIAGLTFSFDNGTFTSYPIGGYTGIISGSHTLIAQNISGCLSPFANFSINAQPASPLAPTVIVVQPSCPVSTGNVSVTSPTTGFTFSFDGAPFATYPTGGYTALAGSHTLAVSNFSGCAPNTTNNIIVNPQPASPSVTAVFTPITCFGGNSTITASATGGILPYEYSLNNGPFQSANTFSATSGSYMVTVRDLNGCTGNTGNIIITQPSALSATATATAIGCNGGTAILTVLATGGLGIYEYSLNNGLYQLANSFIVPAGSYSIKVRLAGNPSCSTSANTLVNVTQPTILKASAKANAINYCGGNTIVTVTATGGKTPYTGTGNFTRGPGNWTFNVIDSYGCSSSTNITILAAGCVDIKVFPNPSQSYISVNHSAAIGQTSYLLIFSENGARILTQNVPQNSFITKINTSKLASGNYLLVYINGQEKKETKFININK